VKALYATETVWRRFVDGLISRTRAIGPVAKRSEFVFSELKSADELRLDYDTTILPPKKVFFPPRQDLLRFNAGKAETCIDPVPTVLIGVHPHDMKAIAMTDSLFTEKYADNHYLANRRATTIIVSNVQTPYRHAFFGTINARLKPTGHDLGITRTSEGYVIVPVTAAGKDLVAEYGFAEATPEQMKEAEDILAAETDLAPRKLRYTEDDIARQMRASFDNDVWNELSTDCFSCGSCNIVCPTCYCFDLQDDWGLGTDNGKRFRRWDACLTSEFAQVSVQGGTENFRESRAERYRHRFMRKTAYLNEKLGGPACVGCGRCAGACTADIADPVTVIHKVMERRK
jgi:sulfhydrogenase subunit beta (sulfur reductase)